MGRFAFACLAFVLLTLGGCPAAGPGFQPGLYSGTMIETTTIWDTWLDFYDTTTQRYDLSIVFSRNGLPMSADGREVAVGLILDANLGGMASTETVTGVTTTADAITVTYTVRITGPEGLTLTGEEFEIYRLLGDGVISLEQTANLADSTNTLTISITAQGTLTL